MTFCAAQAGVFSGQWETGDGVVEGYDAPTFGRVAGTAIRAKLTIVVIFVRMTGIAIRGCSLVAVGMTGLTLNTGMFPDQREAGTAMVERDIGPLRRLMAGTAIRAELSVVVIFIRVAGVAILWCTFVGIVHMARFAGYGIVRPCQWESGIGMIEG